MNGLTAEDMITLRAEIYARACARNAAQEERNQNTIRQWQGMANATGYTYVLVRDGDSVRFDQRFGDGDAGYRPFNERRLGGMTPILLHPAG